MEQKPVIKNVKKLKQSNKIKTKTGTVFYTANLITMKNKPLVNNYFVLVYMFDQNEDHGFNYHVNKAIMKKGYFLLDHMENFFWIVVSTSIYWLWKVLTNISK